MGNTNTVSSQNNDTWYFEAMNKVQLDIPKLENSFNPCLSGMPSQQFP